MRKISASKTVAVRIGTTLKLGVGGFYVPSEQAPKAPKAPRAPKTPEASGALEAAPKDPKAFMAPKAPDS